MSHLLTHKSLGEFAPQTIFKICIALLAAISATSSFAKSTFNEPPIFSKCWELTISSNTGVAPAADASAIYFIDDENRLHSVDAAKGNNLWSTDIGGDVVSNLLLVEDSVFLVTSSQPDTPDSPPKALIRALSRQTGITVWQAETGSSPVVWLGLVNSNVVVAASAGSLAAFARADGRLVWKSDLKYPITSDPHFRDDAIDVATTNKEILKVTGGSGSVGVVWKSKFLPTAVLRDAAGRLVVGDERGNLTLVSSDGDRVWRFRNGAQISSALLHDSEYLASSFDNFVYKLSRGGNVKWKRRLPGRVSDRPIVLGETAVVAIVGTGSVFTLDLENGKISNRIETGDEVSLRVAAGGSDHGFAILGPRGLLYYSSKCSGK
jgi:outer membrane protein assembly factor BamB